MTKLTICFLLLSLMLVLNCSKPADFETNQQNSKPNKATKEVPKDIAELIESLNPLFEPLGEPKAGEWLETFKEDGQTFTEFLNGTPTLPTNNRKTIYIQPIGKFTNKQLNLINQTAKFLGAFYNLQTKLLKSKKF